MYSIVIVILSVDIYKSVFMCSSCRYLQYWNRDSSRRTYSYTICCIGAQKINFGMTSIQITISTDMDIFLCMIANIRSYKTLKKIVQNLLFMLWPLCEYTYAINTCILTFSIFKWRHHVLLCVFKGKWS